MRSQLATFPNPVKKSTQEQIRDYSNGDVYISDDLDVQPGSLWDSLQYVAGGAITGPNSRLFQNCEGDSGKTMADTNMVCNSRLPAPEAFAIRRIMFSFSQGTSDEQMWRFAENAPWRFLLGEKCYLSSVMPAMQTTDAIKAPIRMCDYCRAVYVDDESCPGCGARQFKLTDMSSNSRGAIGRTFYIDLPYSIVILNQMYFCVSFEIATPIVLAAPFKMWCHLEGLHARGVM